MIKLNQMTRMKKNKHFYLIISKKKMIKKKRKELLIKYQSKNKMKKVKININ